MITLTQEVEEEAATTGVTRLSVGPGILVLDRARLTGPLSVALIPAGTDGIDPGLGHALGPGLVIRAPEALAGQQVVLLDGTAPRATVVVDVAIATPDFAVLLSLVEAVLHPGATVRHHRDTDNAL